MKMLSAKNDIVFKKLFSENTDLLRNFIVEMLEIPNENIIQISVKQEEILPQLLKQKFVRLDVKAEIKDKDNKTKLLNIEMQVSNKGDFRERSLYYWTKLYANSLDKGDNYNLLPDCITINILNFNLFEQTDNCHSKFSVMEETRHEVLTDKCAIHFFELKKVGDKKLSEGQETWLQLIKADNKEAFEMLEKKNNPTINKAVDVIQKMSADEQLQEMIRIREKAEHDEASALYNAKEQGKAEGMAQGMAQGIEKGKAELLEQLKQLGLINDENIKSLGLA